MTEAQAVRIAKSEIWRRMTDEQIVRFQLFEDRLCMPFDELHRAVESVLGRPVFTHEFATEGWARLQAEYLGDRPRPTLQEILDLVPEEKRLVLTIREVTP